LPDRLTVNDSGSVAVKAMVCGGLEFNCADATVVATAIMNRDNMTSRAQFLELDFIGIFPLPFFT